jgi:hypothetical protein
MVCKETRMTGDFSRNTFDPKKGYTRVLIQQGRVAVDADPNEQSAIYEHRIETEAQDVIGQSGFPKTGGGFIVKPDTTLGSDLTISAGRFYVEGLLCVLESSTTITKQPFHLTAPLPTASGRYLAYLDAWQRHITAIEDPSIREVALGGPDTATRSQTVWQVKLLSVANGAMCGSLGAAWTQKTARTTATLKAQVNPAPPSAGLCDIPPGANFQGQENQLYRVEVHQGGEAGKATFKWSRDNGSIVTGVTSINVENDKQVEVQDLGRDSLHGFGKGDLVEVTDDVTDLGLPDNAPPKLTTIDDLKAQHVTLKDAPTGIVVANHAKMRRWDGTGTITVSSDPKKWIALENGVEIQFQGTDFRSGDYWLIPARTATGKVEWKTDSAGKPLPQPPEGVRHHFAPLALLDWDGTQSRFTPVPGSEDCRLPFPPLTNITAEDVYFTNTETACNAVFSGVKTVQDALEALCKVHRGACTYIAAPGDDLQALFESIGDGKDAAVCFTAGVFEIFKPIIIKKKGHLKISGAGWATHLKADKAEAALVFENCSSVTVRDLSAETGITSSIKTENALNGTLSFVDCLEVLVEAVRLKCGAGGQRSATCLVVRNRPPDPTQPSRPFHSARILHNTLLVGQFQTGLLLVNVHRSEVEDNRIQPASDTAAAVTTLLSDNVFRGQARRILVGRAVVESGMAAVGRNMELRVGNHLIRFRTPNSLRQGWAELLRNNPARRADTPEQALRHLQRLATQILTDAAFRGRASLFNTWFNSFIQGDYRAGAQGIVIAGIAGEEMRVLNNSIERMNQGIHIGFSQKEQLTPGRETRKHGGSLTISGNRIGFVLPISRQPAATHGIFVGNCDSILVSNNRVQRLGAPDGKTEKVPAIYLHGAFGRRLLVTQNHIDGCTPGINLVPDSQSLGGGHLWLAAENFAQQAALAVDAPSSVIKRDNFT